MTTYIVPVHSPTLLSLNDPGIEQWRDRLKAAGADLARVAEAEPNSLDVGTILSIVVQADSPDAARVAALVAANACISDGAGWIAGEPALWAGGDLTRI